MAKTQPTAGKSDKPATASTGIFRNKAVNVIVVVLAMVLAATFLIDPSMLGSTVGQRIVFGSYDGRPIDNDPDGVFSTKVRAFAYAREQQGGSVSTQADEYEVMYTAFNDTIRQYGLLSLAEETGVGVSDQSVNDRVLSLEIFTENGAFSLERFNAMPATEKVILKNQIKESMIADLIAQDLEILNLTTEAEANFVASITDSKRSVVFVLFTNQTFPDARVREYVQNNPGLFRAVELSVITMGTAEEVENIRSRIVSGELTFEAAALQYSTDSFAGQGGRKGRAYVYDIARDLGSAETANLVSALPGGELSEVLPLPDGRFSLYRVDSAATELDTSSAADLDVARNYIANYELDMVLQYLETASEEFSIAAQTQGFRAAAAERQLEVVESAEFTVNIGDLPMFTQAVRKDGTPLVPSASATMPEEFYREVFATDIGNTSKPIKVGQGYLVVSPVSTNGGQQFEKDYITGSALPQALAQWNRLELFRFIKARKTWEDNFFRNYLQYYTGIGAAR